MAIRDLRTAPQDMVVRTDVAIVGGGPAGLTIARELANSHINVTIIDSGGFGVDEEAQTFNRVDNVGEPRQRSGAEEIGRGYTGGLAWLNDVPAFELRHRGLGGSTRTWIGKCAAFDEIDFEKRAWVPGSGWPFSRAGLEPHLDRAAALLNLGPNVYDERLYSLLRSPPPQNIFDPDMLRPFFWQFSHERDIRGEPMRFARLARSLDTANIDILTHATVTEVHTDPSGRRVASLDILSANGNKATIHAGTVVLCGGGVENARLLLASNSVMPAGVGNATDMVGRYLADHPRTVLARFARADIDTVARHFGFYGLAGRGRSHFYLHGLSLSPHLQRREGLLNCAAYPVQSLSEDDPWHALKRLAGGSGSTFVADALTVLKSPHFMAKGLYERLVRGRGLPRRAVELRFDVMTEQRPNPDSRVTLSGIRNQYGMRLPKVDWRIGTAEIKSIRHLAELICATFMHAGLPEPLLADWVTSGDSDRVPFKDMAHPSGTTRMGTDPKSSVVDADCMVHGIEGLFVAGSSVFPTAGHANPTLMITALSIRLADHLKAYCGATQSHSNTAAGQMATAGQGISAAAMSMAQTADS